MKKVIDILKFIWQFPQAVIGWILGKLYYHDAEYDYKDGDVRVIINRRFHGGISLCPFIILNRSKKVDVAHEMGHTKQSKILGPLYLLVIGLPSILWAWYWTADRKVDYYWFYTERWADVLGGVKIDKNGRRYV